MKGFLFLAFILFDQEKKSLDNFQFLPTKVHQGLYKTTLLSVVTNGKCPRFGVDNVGTTPAAISATIAINELKPSIVISAGTSGGFKRAGAQIGDAFISTSCVHHDRRIPIPGFTEYGKGGHTSFPVPSLIQVGSAVSLHTVACNFFFRIDNNNYC
jgi:hypothetical protein